MGRPKGSTNKPKTDGNSAKAPKSGPQETPHQNSAPLTDDQAHALLDQSARSYAKALEAKKRYDAELKLVCKAIKADGVKLSDVKLYIEAATEEGQEAIRKRAEDIARIARWRNFAVGHQADMFDEGSPTTNRSFVAGREAGMGGEKAEVPLNYDSENWMAGWHAGQEALLTGGIKQTPAEDRDFN